MTRKPKDAGEPNDDTFEGFQPPPVYDFRSYPVVLDADVAALFDYATGRLNEQVKRNLDRFPETFAFQLTDEEFADLRSQKAISSEDGHGGRRTSPWVFTEYGVVMAATVLRSDRAVTASIFIVKTFVEARRNQLALKKGKNSPATIDPRAVLPISASARHGLMAKLDATLGRVLDAIADPHAGTTIREEARAIAAEAISAIKAHLSKQDTFNKKTLAEVRKLLKEAEALDADLTAKHIENEHRRLAYIAKQLRIALELQRYLETGSADGLLLVLKDLGGV